MINFKTINKAFHLIVLRNPTSIIAIKSKTILWKLFFGNLFAIDKKNHSHLYETIKVRLRHLLFQIV